jgi:HEAT repeat protein
MGLFDVFARKGPGAVRKHIATLTNKHSQKSNDRFSAIESLGRMQSEEAVRALLRRFTIRVDPSITDQQEKEAAFQAIVGCGEVGVPAVVEFLRSASSVSWPVKALEKLLPPEGVVAELIALLDELDTEYQRDPSRKVQLVAYLEDRRDPRIVEKVTRFVDDMNEEVRFHAVGAVLSQENAADVRDALTAAFLREESVRIRARILEGFFALGWQIPEAERPEFQKRLPAGFGLDPGGNLRRH